MRNGLMGLLVVGAFAASGGRASAWQYGHSGPWAQTAAFPCANPPGWYTNTYSYAWQYPWFAYYNYSHGPYANWMAGGGYAGYSSCGGLRVSHADGTGVMAPAAGCATGGCQVTINLPADAKLLFNGVAATGSGAVRTFSTPPLQFGHDYGYDLTAEVVRNGKVERHTEKVVVRAGEKASVTLTPGGVQTASAK